jgi:uncharacterized membrane protein
MSKSSKIFTGILSFLPFIAFAGYFIFFFTFMLGTIMTVGQGNPPDEALFLNNFILMAALIGVMSLITIIALIYFIVHIAGNKKLDNNERIVWILIVIFVGMIGFPVYWYIKIWQDEEKTPVQGF